MIVKVEPSAGKWIVNVFINGEWHVITKDGSYQKSRTAFIQWHNKRNKFVICQ